MSILSSRYHLQRASSSTTLYEAMAAALALLIGLDSQNIALRSYKMRSKCSTLFLSTSLPPGCCLYARS
jgi:hypothetical protein